MSKREQLNQLLNEEKIARATVEQLCNDWEWTLSDKEATVVNNITINKGKVTAIEITKEDNSTIEMLRETIRQMNQNMNDINKEHDELYKLYLEEQREKEVWAAAHDELKDELEVKEAIIENLKAQNKALNEQLKEEKEKQPRVVYVEVADDHTYDNEPEPEEEEVVNEVEEIIVPVTKEEKKQTTVTTESGLTFEIHKTHDAVKAKITEGQKVFYAVWSINDKAPAYSYVDKYNHYCRAKEWWKYDRLVKPELRALREELMNELKDKKNKNNTRKSVPQISKEVVKETPEEITIPTNDTVESTNDVSAFDDMEFC